MRAYRKVATVSAQATEALYGASSTWRWFPLVVREAGKILGEEFDRSCE